MKFLLISSEFPPGPGGIGRHAFSLAKELRMSNELTILTNQDWAEEKEKYTFNTEELKGVSFKRLLGRNIPGYRLWRVAQAISVAKKLKPAQVFLTGKYSLWIGLVLKKLGIRATYIGFVHGSEVGRLADDRLTQKSLNALNRIVPVSNFTKSLVELFITDKSKIHVLPNGVDADFLELANGSMEQLLWVGNPRLITVGNLTPRKGQHQVIKALPVIKAQFPNVHYHMVGLPTHQKELERLASDLQLNNHITFHGRLPAKEDVMRAYASADVFVMLSENQPNGDVEGFGIAILEANAFGLPAIGAKGCGIEDAITADSGILVDGNNYEEIVDALIIILQNYRHYSLGARKWAEKHNWLALVKSLDFSRE